MVPQRRVDRETEKPHSARFWYAEKLFNMVGLAVLVHQIELDLYGREGRAITNFPGDVVPGAVRSGTANP